MREFSYHAETHVGKVRDNNEDTFIAQPIWDDRHFLFVVIDGMGGYEGGEVAAEIARKTIVKYLEEFSQGKPLELLKQAVLDANNEVVRYKDFAPKYRSMGCVISAGLYEKDHSVLNIVHVGDTRVYLFSEGKLQKLTHDHSLVGYQEEQGELTEEEAMNHPQRSIIERYVGETTHMLGDNNFIDAAIFPINKSSQLVFCSDGLYDMVTSGEIIDVLKGEEGVKKKSKALVNLANQHGGKDNVTVIVVSINVEETKKEELSADNVAEVNLEKPNETKRRGYFFFNNWRNMVLMLILGFVCGYFVALCVVGQRVMLSDNKVNCAIGGKDSSDSKREYKSRLLHELSMRLIEQDDTTRYPLIESTLRDSIFVLKNEVERCRKDESALRDSIFVLKNGIERYRAIIEKYRVLIM